MSDFFDRMIARVQGDAPRVEPVLPSWFETRGPNHAAADSASAAPADFEWSSVPWFADENRASDSPAIASSYTSDAPPRPAQSQFSARVSTTPQADDRASYSGPADVADVASSVLSSPRPETRPVTASQPAEPRAQRQVTAAASAERDTTEPPVPRPARAHEPVATRPMPNWPGREPSVQELVTKVHAASLAFRSEPATGQPILPARTRGLLEPAGPAPTDRSSRAPASGDETNQPAKIRSIRPDDDRASSAVPAEAAGPTIHITIGRVELRTVTSSARVVSAPTPAPAQPALSLDEYLRQRAGGAR